MNQTQNVNVHRYKNAETREQWQGYIEPDDLSWIVFVDAHGAVTLYDERDAETGAVVA